MMPVDQSTPWRRLGETIVVRFRLTPKGGRDSIEGLADTPDGRAIKARVRAAPEDNAANLALATLVADWLDLPKRHVTLIGGHKSRTKSVAILGEPTDLARRLTALIAELEN